MHPLLLGRMRPALYLGTWAGIGALLVALLALGHPRPLEQVATFVAPLTLAYAFVCLSAWWVCRAHPIGTTPPERLVVTLLGAALQASVVWVALGALWAVLLARAAHAVPDCAAIQSDLAALFIAGVLLYAESIVVHYFLLAFESARAAERRVLASQVTAREAELRALRAQINPHFLFNSL